MTSEVYRYHFFESVPFDDVEASLVLAIMSVESLHGTTNVRLNAGHATDAPTRCCVIDASTDVGLDLNRLFLGFLSREFGDDAFTVERISGTTPANAKPIHSPNHGSNGDFPF